MKLTEMECPVCDADIPLAGDERNGDEVFCGHCGVRSEYKKLSEDEEASLEPDF